MIRRPIQTLILFNAITCVVGLYTFSGIQPGVLIENEHQPAEVSLSFSQREASACSTAAAQSASLSADAGTASEQSEESIELKPDQPEYILNRVPSKADKLESRQGESESEPDELEPESDEPASKSNEAESKAGEAAPKTLIDILNNYYEGSEVVVEEKAFIRVIDWKEDFENIAAKYSNVNWKMLSAVAKAETQGRTGIQESSAKAVGMTQIKYQGAWAFLWDALFKKEVKEGSRYVKDYYNANLRKRYHSQLQQIRRYLEQQGILAESTDRSESAYNAAKLVSWQNLKSRLRKKYRPGEYQVCVDISAMYIDHLISTLRKVKHQIAKIRDYAQGSDLVSLNEAVFPGTTGIRWDSIRSKLGHHRADFRKTTLARLNHIIKKLEEPGLYSAAYNLGISRCLEYVESGKKFPLAISRYVKTVAAYYTIFNAIAASWRRGLRLDMASAGRH